jgi:hypothetical protein
MRVGDVHRPRAHASARGGGVDVAGVNVPVMRRAADLVPGAGRGPRREMTVSLVLSPRENLRLARFLV